MALTLIADNGEGDPRRRIERPIDMLVFATAGHATFTLEGKATRFTYRVERSDDGKVYFVSVLTGPSNEADYSYLGIIENREHGRFRRTAKSRIDVGAPSSRAFDWFWQALTFKDEHRLAQVAFWHEGRCGRCGRTLTVPESIERGIGPDCAGKMGMAA